MGAAEVKDDGMAAWQDAGMSMGMPTINTNQLSTTRRGKDFRRLAGLGLATGVALVMGMGMGMGMGCRFTSQRNAICVALFNFRQRTSSPPLSTSVQHYPNLVAAVCHVRGTQDPGSRTQDEGGRTMDDGRRTCTRHRNQCQNDCGLTAPKNHKDHNCMQIQMQSQRFTNI
uniref:HDC19860 n=1 Tax=Drosophila melanogaster TaxID=7227 RepID=Q6II37_DROME|nr:TPA_inf: HDC19860 [Drosophila melanogaster]